MSRTCELNLTPRQRRALLRLRDHDPKPHRREKAAAILKVADGWRIGDVARVGLLRPRNPKTVSAWIARYKTHGLAGLRVRAGRGRKPAFFPLPPRAGQGPIDPTAAAQPAGKRPARRPLDAAPAGGRPALAGPPQ